MRPTRMNLDALEYYIAKLRAGYRSEGA